MNLVTQSKGAFWRNARSCIVLAACLVIAVLNLGTARVAAVLFLPCIERYGTKRQNASFPFILCYAVRCISGPLTGFLGKKYGLAAITISGAVLSSIGIGLCFFAEDILMVTISWGVIYGIGFGMGSTLIPQILSYHFDKHFDKASGFFYGGSSIGALVIPLIADMSLKTYGTSGTFLILSALMMNSVPAAMLLRKRRDGKRSDIRKAAEKSQTDTHKSAVYSVCSELTKETEQECVTLSGISGRYNKLGILDAKLITPKQDLHTNVIQNVTLQHCNAINVQKSGTTEKVSPQSPFSKPQKERNSKFYYFRVFLDPTFILILVTQSTYILTTSTFWTVVIDFASDVGVAEHEEIYIIIVIAITDIVSRFTLGGITDGGCIDKINFSAICFAGMSILLVALVWVKGFAMVMAAICIFGLFVGGQIIVQPGIILKVIDKENISMALASRYFLFAPFSFTVSPLIGFFRDT